MPLRRNGDIDFLRFVFSLCIVFFHFGATFKKSIFCNGYFGVEFFFLVTGYLMAMHGGRLQERKAAVSNIGTETWSFVINKVRKFYKYYICVVCIQLLTIDIFASHTDVFETITVFLKSIPVLLLMNMGLDYGSGGVYIAGMWYLSAMMIALFLLYPWMLKDYDFAVKWLYPVISLFVIGYLYHTFNTISIWNKWAVLSYAAILRAAAEIALGASLFDLSDHLVKNSGSSKLFTSAGGKTFLTLLKIFCFGAALIFAKGSFRGADLERELDLYFLFLLAAGVVLSFSGAGFCLPDCKLTRLLSKYSLGIYIFHSVWRMGIAEFYDAGESAPKQYAIYLLITIAGCIILTYLTDLIAGAGHRLIHKNSD